MKLPSFSLQAPHVLAVIAAASGIAQAAVPTTMQRDFVTARNHIVMKWNPLGYWASAAGAFRGTGNPGEACAAFTQTEVLRGKIPAGYSFSVSGSGQFVASNGPISKLSAPASRPAAPVAAAPVPEAAPAPVPAPEPVKRAEVVTDTPPVMSPSARRMAILDPVHATSPTAAPQAPPTVKVPPPPIPPPPPSGPAINGIPGDMQKSFLSRHKPVFMMFDKDAGKWKSSEGAIKDPSTADEWCKLATEIDRRDKRIPESFSYKHVGGGQVEATRD